MTETPTTRPASPFDELPRLGSIVDVTLVGLRLVKTGRDLVLESGHPEIPTTIRLPFGEEHPVMVREVVPPEWPPRLPGQMWESGGARRWVCIRAHGPSGEAEIRLHSTDGFDVFRECEFAEIGRRLGPWRLLHVSTKNPPDVPVAAAPNGNGAALVQEPPTEPIDGDIGEVQEP